MMEQEVFESDVFQNLRQQALWTYNPGEKWKTVKFSLAIENYQFLKPDVFYFKTSVAQRVLLKQQSRRDHKCD